MGGDRHRAAPQTVALAAGGTAGHVMIALAIAEAFERASPGIDILLLGARHGTETRLVASRGFRLELLPGSPWKRERLGGKLAALWQLVRALRPARRLLAANSVDLVLGTGGYASIGALAAARSLGTATALHEANVVPGLANRFLGRTVGRVYLSSEAAASCFPRDRCLVTGTPLRTEIARLAHRTKPPPAAGRPRRVLVTAGSEGSPFLDREVPPLLGRVARLGIDLETRHQVGDSDPGPVREAYAAVGVSAEVVEFLDDMAGAYDWADLAIACCGAGTVAELAVAGLPSLLVPLAAAADDHQAENARLYATATGAWTLTEEEWRSADPGTRIAEILADEETWRSAANALGPLAAPDAANVLVADCLAWLDRRH